jgi:hypothetical protein
MGQTEPAGLIRGEGWRPVGGGRSERPEVPVDQRRQHFADDAASDGPKPLAVVPRVGLLEHVEPERRLPDLAAVRQAHFLRRQRVSVMGVPFG